MFRLLPLLLLGGCYFLEEGDDDDFPTPVCGDGVAEYGEQCDDGNFTNSDSCSSTCKTLDPYTVHWRTESVAAGTQHSCPLGFDRANVIAQAVVLANCSMPSGCTFTPTGEPIVVTSACSDGAKRLYLPELPPTTMTYRVAVAFESSSTGEVYGETLSTWLEEVTDVVMYEDAGFVHVAWKFHSAEWGTLDCFNANVADVTVNVRKDNWTAATQTVPCMTLATYTPPVVAGVYDVELVTSRATTTVSNVTIDDRSALTDLGAVTIELP